MPRDVYTYTYDESSSHNYLPLAPLSSSLKSQLSEVQDYTRYQLYDNKNEPVGYLWETENMLKIADNSDKSTEIYNASSVIYFDEKTDSDVSYIMFNYFYKYTLIGGVYDDSNFLIKANATGTGGKYLNKNVVVTYKQVGNTGKYKLILDY